MSEFSLSTSPRPGNFPRRNPDHQWVKRGVLVVEAAIRSGSLVTARCALEQGREVLRYPARWGTLAAKALTG